MALDLKAALRIQATVDGTASIKGLEQSLAKVDANANILQRTFSKLKGVAGGITGALGGLVPALGVAGILALAKRSIDAASNLNALSQSTGVSVKSLSKFQAAANDSGTSIETVSKAITTLSRGLIAAGVGTNNYVDKFSSSLDRSLKALKKNEEEQTRAVRDQAFDRLNVLQDETDDRLKEINKRYRTEQQLLDDNHDDQADAYREAAEQSLRQEQRRISQRYDVIQTSIQQNQNLSDQDRRNQLDNLRAQEDQEKDSLERRFSKSQKLRDRQARDIKTAEQDALEDRRRAEENQIKKNLAAQKTLLETGAAAQIAVIEARTADASKALESNSKGVSDALAFLGISSVDAANKLRPTDQLMLEVADKFANMVDGAQKTALAIALFGKSGAELIPMLNQGSDALSKYNASLTGEGAATASKFGDSLNKLSETLKGPFNDALMLVLPHATKFAETISAAIKSLPAPLQTALGVIVGLVAAFVLLAPAITAVVPLIKILIGLKLLATLSGWLGAVAAIGPALLTVGKILLAIFTGPVGWAVLLVAAGVAIYAFRDQIGAAFQAAFQVIGEFFNNLGRKTLEVFQVIGKFFSDAAQKTSDGFYKTFANLANALKAPFVAVATMIKGVMNGVLRGVFGVINSAINYINNLMAVANAISAKVKGPQLGRLPNLPVPQFAAGGVVSGPTMAMVGEGGEREYIIPESKMGRASANYLSGARGAGVIPAFANGGVVGGTTVQITTGPVLQQQGQRYVTMEDLEQSLQTLAGSLLGNSRSAGGRRFQGVG